MAVKGILAAGEKPAGSHKALVPFGDTKHVYYAWDKKKPVFHQQRVYSGGHDTSAGTMHRSFWSPHVKGNPEVSLNSKKEWIVTCGDSETPVQQVSGGEKNKLLA